MKLKQKGSKCFDSKFQQWKPWLYLLPAFVFLGAFMVYPLIDVLIYSFEEGFNFASQQSFGVGG